MVVNTKEIYSEVYSILDLLGDKYINRLPKKLYNLIESEKTNTYNPKYDITIPLYEQNVKRESISMIALFHLNYWSESNLDKEELREIFNKNEKRYQEELREKYNPDNIFKSKKEKQETNYKKTLQETAIIECNNKSFLQKIFDKIKHLFRK